MIIWILVIAIFGKEPRIETYMVPHGTSCQQLLATITQAYVEGGHMAIGKCTSFIIKEN